MTEWINTQQQYPSSTTHPKLHLQYRNYKHTSPESSSKGECSTPTLTSTNTTIDSNLTINILLNIIHKYHDSLPPVLYIQLDNTARENKNKHLHSAHCLLSLLSRRPPPGIAFHTPSPHGAPELRVVDSHLHLDRLGQQLPDRGIAVIRKHNQKGRKQSDKYISIIIDRMDQHSTAIPEFSHIRKAESTIQKLQTHIIGVIVQGRAQHTYIHFN